MGFSVLSTRCYTKSPTNLLVIIYGFQCIVFKVSRKRSYQSTGSYIWLLVYCLPGITQKVLPIYRFLYTGFFIEEYIKKIWDVPQPQQPITFWRVEKYAAHLNLLVLIYGFQCIVYPVSHKRSYQSTGSYIWLLVYCLPGVTQKVLPIQRFLDTGFFFQDYMKKIWDVPQPQQPITIWRVQKYAVRLNLFLLIYGFQCTVYQVSHKRSYQSSGSYIWVLVYCVPGVTQKVPTNLQVLVYVFQCIVYQVSHKRSYQSTCSYRWDFSFRNISRRFGMFLNHNSQSLF